MKKIIMRTSICFFLFTSAFSSITHAQPLTPEDMRMQMVKEWERAKAYTMDYLNSMPADKYSYKAVDSIRSFAQQMLHLAQGNVFLMSNASDMQAPAYTKANLESSAGAQQKDSVVYYVTNSYDYCINAVKVADLAKMGEKKKVFGMDVTRMGLMMKTFEHQTHHRGQAAIYIRLQGIRPPNERLF
jgi:uncharacterized damage-inducible protein DinB